MPRFAFYISVLGSATVLSVWLTAVMTRKKVSVGIRKFIVSTIGTLALLVAWAFLR